MKKTDKKDGINVESIGDITPNVYNEIQHYVLDMFLEYQRQSKDFQMMIRATAADTKGAQKNMDDNKAWLKEVEEVKFKNRFTNLNKIYEESVVSEVHKAVVESVKIFKPLYYFESNPVVSKAKRELIDVVEGSMSLTKDAKSKLANTVNNDLIAAIATMNFNETEDGKKVVDKFSLGVAFEELFIKNDKFTKRLCFLMYYLTYQCSAFLIYLNFLYFLILYTLINTQYFLNRHLNLNILKISFILFIVLNKKH